MLKKEVIKTMIFSIYFVLVNYSLVFAQGGPDVINVGRPSQVQIVDAGRLISALIGVILILAALASLFYIFWGGIEWLMSGGVAESTEKARNKIASAIIGLLIVFSSWALMIIIEKFLGFTLISGPIKIPYAYSVPPESQKEQVTPIVIPPTQERVSQPTQIPTQILTPTPVCRLPNTGL